MHVLWMLVWVAVAVAASEPDRESPVALPVPRDDDEAGGAKLNKDEGLLTELGPIVVREDGTMGRLKDWRSMTMHEKLAVLKTVQRRNAERREKIRQAEQHEL